MLKNLKPMGFEIPTDNPFVNDKLDRQKCIVTLTNLVTNVPGPLVISLNGGWGTGKTVFLKMWKQYLANNGFSSLYFSAWEDDYCNDALVALIGQIWASLKNSDYGEIARSVKLCAAPLIKSTVFNAIRTMTVGIVDLSEEQLQSASEKTVDEYLAAGEKLKELKGRLNDLAQQVRSKTQKPLILIIDEIDRCRPTFAIELLEKIKHLFDIPGIVFVLGIDREQLGHSVKSVYGADMDVNGYLRRFIDMEFLLPKTDTKAFISHLFNQLGLSQCFHNRCKVSREDQNGGKATENVFLELCRCLDISLRDIEYCIKLIILAYGNTPDNLSAFPPLLCMLIVLKSVNNLLYNEYTGGHCTSEKVIELILTKPRGEIFLDSYSGILTESYLFAVSPTQWRDNAYNQLEGFLKTHSKPPSGRFLYSRAENMKPETLEKFLKIITNLMNDPESEVSCSTLGYLSEKIELASLLVDYKK